MKIPPTVVTFLLMYAGVTYSQVRRIDKIVKGTGSKDTTILYAKDSCYWDYFSLGLKENLPDGEYQIFENDTLSFKGFYIHNLKDSIWTYYYTNGNVFSIIPYKGGKIHGVLKQYDNIGTLLNESNYEFGKMSGQSKNFSKSGIEAIVYYEDDTMQKREMYYTNGKLKSMENFKSGKSHGTNTEYFENGNIREIEYNDHGNRIRLIIYDKSGKVTLDEHY